MSAVPFTQTRNRNASSLSAYRCACVRVGVRVSVWGGMFMSGTDRHEQWTSG